MPGEIAVYHYHGNLLENFCNKAFSGYQSNRDNHGAKGNIKIAKSFIWWYFQHHPTKGAIEKAVFAFQILHRLWPLRVSAK